MQSKYNQFRALVAITKASLLAIIKNPGSLFFSLVFPLVFVWVFGFFGMNGFSKQRVSFSQGTDTTNKVFAILQNMAQINIISYSNDSLQKLDLERGELDAVLHITTNKDSTQKEQYTIQVTATNATAGAVAQLMPYLENISLKVNPEIKSNVHIQQNIYTIRPYRQIDFILPGQIGFSVLFSTLFGIAFTFYNLREQLVLKRFFASPVNKLSILSGIGFSRLSFQLLNVVVLIVVGKFWLGFTLAHGMITFLEMIFISILMLLLLMGIGLIFSSIVKTDATIPLLINLFALPQMLLSGTFFPISVFPEWMQTLCKIFPLTHFNEAMRKISFEGLGITEVWNHLAIIGLWGIVVYVIIYKIFKWE
ncbi:MAG: ABC transporter permease [Chitinophagaceae bacterium]|nr:ABC transporter permease [Chitinophagaceae bacterium]MCW5904805.1 ABC transporter permease [Chitinophagaceae bacterium]